MSEAPPTRNLRALHRFEPVDVVGMSVRPASIPAGVGCRPGDYLADVVTEVADRWIAAGLAEEVQGPIPSATNEPG